MIRKRERYMISTEKKVWKARCRHLARAGFRGLVPALEVRRRFGSIREILRIYSRSSSDFRARLETWAVRAPARRDFLEVCLVMIYLRRLIEGRPEKGRRMRWEKQRLLNEHYRVVWKTCIREPLRRWRFQEMLSMLVGELHSLEPLFLFLFWGKKDNCFAY